MKFIVPVITLLVGFASGWILANQRMDIKIKERFPEELQSSLEAAYEFAGDMSAEELEEMMKEIRATADKTINEVDQQILWMASSSMRFKNQLESKGAQAAIEYADYQIGRFHEAYERGMNLGDLQQIADATYSATRTTREPSH